MAEAAAGALPAGQQGGQSASTPPEGTPAPSDKVVFTPEQQKHINSILAGERRRYDERLEAKEKENTDLRQQTTQLTEKVTGIEGLLKEIAGIDDSKGDEHLTDLERWEQAQEGLPPKPGWVKTAADYQLWLSGVRQDAIAKERDKRYQQSVTELTGKLAESDRRFNEQVARQAEREKISAQRSKDALLAKACADGEAFDATTVMRYWDPLLIYDAPQDRWVIKDETGSPVEAYSYIMDHFLDIHRKPVVSTGGSGGNGGRAPDPKAELAAAEQRLKDAEEKARSGNQRFIGEYQRAKREVEQLRAKANGARAAA